MRWFQITLDLKNNEKDYAPLANHIEKTYKGFLKIMKTSYLVESKESEAEIFKKLIPFIDSEDSVLVTQVARKNSAGRLDEGDWAKFK